MSREGDVERADSSSSVAGVRQQLLHNARQCSHARDTYFDRLLNAEGKDVYKYVLLLNCVECHEYVAITQLQALTSFSWSVRAALAGFGVVIASSAAMTFLQAAGTKIDFTTISLISGVLTAFISSVFFYLYNESLKRMERFHDRLREVQKIVFGLFMQGTSGEPAQSDEERKEILRFLMHPEGRADSDGKNSKADAAAAA
jgi:hypothetical protein